MLDIGATELLVIGLVLILVVGPKDLPRVLRTMGQWSRKMRGLAREFQSSMDDLAREADVADMRKELDSISGKNIGKTIENTVDADGSLRDAAKTDYAAETPAPAGNADAGEKPASDGDGDAAEKPAADGNGDGAEKPADANLADLAPGPDDEGEGQESSAPAEPAPKEEVRADGAAEA